MVYKKYITRNGKNHVIIKGVEEYYEKQIFQIREVKTITKSVN